MVKQVGQYILQEVIGKGSFGKVQLSLNTQKGNKAAIKIIEKAKIKENNMGAQIKKEITVM